MACERSIAQPLYKVYSSCFLFPDLALSRSSILVHHHQAKVIRQMASFLLASTSELLDRENNNATSNLAAVGRCKLNIKTSARRPRQLRLSVPADHTSKLNRPAPAPAASAADKRRRRACFGCGRLHVAAARTRLRCESIRRGLA